MATARDVAQLAGCSNAVVSYIFNNGPRAVAPDTRERVLRAAAMLNYKPNVIASTLSGGRSRSIGLIVPDITNPFFAEFARELEDHAARHDHLLLIGDAAMAEAREDSLIDSFIERKVDSLVISTVRTVLDAETVRAVGIPIVALHGVDTESTASSVVIDYEEAAYAATRHLADQGHRRIGVLGGPEGSVMDGNRNAGFRRAVRDFGLTASARSSAYTRASAYDALMRWRADGDLPPALFVTSDEQAFGVLSAAYESGLAIPAQLAVVSIDGTDAGRYAVPSLSSVRQPVSEMAAEVVRILINRRLTDPPTHSVLRSELMIRASSGAIRQSSSV